MDTINLTFKGWFEAEAELEKGIKKRINLSWSSLLTGEPKAQITYIWPDGHQEMYFINIILPKLMSRLMKRLMQRAYRKRKEWFDDLGDIPDPRDCASDPYTILS